MSAAWYVVIPTVATLGACGRFSEEADPSSPDPVATSAGADVPADSDEAAHLHELAELMPFTADERELLHRLEQHLYRSCMQERGLDYVELPTVPGPEPEPTREWRLEHGYGLSPDPEGQVAFTAAVEANQYNRENQPGWAAALDSCTGRIFSTPLPDGVMSVAEQHGRELAQAMASVGITDADPAVVEAKAAWRTCMGDAGFAVTEAGEQVSRFLSDRAAGGGPTDDEITIAVAEFDCAVSSGLMAAERTAVSDRVAAVLREHADVVEQMRAAAAVEVPLLYTATAELGTA
jgi:hypothetical protein